MSDSKGNKLKDKTRAIIILSVVIGLVLVLVAVPYFVNVLGKRAPEPAVEVDIPNSGQVDASADEDGASAAAPEAESANAEESSTTASAETASAATEDNYTTSEVTYYYAPAPAQADTQSHNIDLIRQIGSSRRLLSQLPRRRLLLRQLLTIIVAPILATLQTTIRSTTLAVINKGCSQKLVSML